MEEITMKKLNLKNLAVLVLVFALLLMTTACGAGEDRRRCSGSLR